MQSKWIWENQCGRLQWMLRSSFPQLLGVSAYVCRCSFESLSGNCLQQQGAVSPKVSPSSHGQPKSNHCLINRNKVQLWKASPVPELPVGYNEAFLWLHHNSTLPSAILLLSPPLRCWSWEHSSITIPHGNLQLKVFFPGNLVSDSFSTWI